MTSKGATDNQASQTRQSHVDYLLLPSPLISAVVRGKTDCVGFTYIKFTGFTPWWIHCLIIIIHKYNKLIILLLYMHDLYWGFKHALINIVPTFICIYCCFFVSKNGSMVVKQYDHTVLDKQLKVLNFSWKIPGPLKVFDNDTVFEKLKVIEKSLNLNYRVLYKLMDMPLYIQFHN